MAGRRVDAPAADVVAELKRTGTGDILVNTSPSILKPLAADLVDRLFDDGLPASKWVLAGMPSGDLGELALVYDRAR